ncbi:hypothetical protein EJB05_22766, partial [Eragrostis curvula]
MASPGYAANDIGVPSRSAIVGGTDTGHHLLDIEGYSLTKEPLPTGKCICSSSFYLSARASSWRICYFPNGDQPDDAEFISVYLELYYGGVVPVSGRARFSLLNQAGQPVPSHSQITEMHDFIQLGGTRFGFSKFIKRAWLEESEHLKDDRFTIRCDVFVSKELRTESRAAPPAFVKVPPSDLHLHFGNLLEDKKGADVMYQVGGETFLAHRCVLAARSAVFEAELFGPMKESANMAVIPVVDMEAEVFGALLHFVYTDMLHCGSGSKLQQASMAQHLLVAADRYGLERLKLLCEDKLCKHIDMDSVVTILLLAEQHNCPGLKKACFKFLSSPIDSEDSNGK